MKKSTTKKFIFLTPEGLTRDQNLPPEAIKKVFDVYRNISNPETEPKPFLDVFEMSEDFFHFLVNKISVDLGIVAVTKNLLSYEEQNVKILCVPPEDLQKYLGLYKESLTGVLNKLVENKNQIMAELVNITLLQNKTLKPLES